MRQYIMLGIIAAGVLVLAVFLFISLRPKKSDKESKADKSLFTELEESSQVFPEDYKTEVLIDKGYQTKDKISADKPEDTCFNPVERITVNKNSNVDGSAADFNEDGDCQKEGYIIENCTIKSLNVDEKLFKKLNLKSCSIENICLVSDEKKGSEESL